MGIGKPLRSILHMNPDIPIWLGTGTETNVKLTAEIADGWLPLGYVPQSAAMYRPWVEEGFRRAGNGKSWKDFEVQASTTVIITDDVRDALRRMKPNIALYVGGMGHRNKNFHNDMMVRRGYGDAAQTIQELYLAGRKGEAIEAVPDEFVDEGALVGPVARIREKFREWEDTGATGLTVNATQDEAIELMAELTGAAKGRGPK
jgi:alkanesulfonate monooxygenase SsuD/methylene tetrahydromethanopterin reductase-like flavin-dependent oxidoreductase (luciferase family)